MSVAEGSTCPARKGAYVATNKIAIGDLICHPGGAKRKEFFEVIHERCLG